MRGRKVKDVLLHSDQGSIYTVKEFQAYAKENGIITSMSRRGNCHDNAVMESLFGHLKSEAFYSQEITKVSNTTVRKIVLEYIHYYNCVRIQEKLTTYPLRNLRNKWFRCFDRCPVFGVHFSLEIGSFFILISIYIPK